MKINKIDYLIYGLIGLITWLSMAFLPGWVIIIAVILGTLTIVFRFQPHLALALIMLAVPFGIKKDVIGGFTIYTPEALALMFSLAWLVQIVKEKKINFSAPLLTISILLFFVSILFSYFNALSLAASIK